MSAQAAAPRRRDPLLGTVRAALSFGMVAAVLIAATIIVCTPLLFVFDDRILAGLARRTGTVLDYDFIYAIFGVQLLVAVTATLGYFFIRHLRRIVDTVAQGDPFIPDNALRLRHMGWITVAMQLIAIPAGALSGWISYTGKMRYVDVGVSLGGVLLALILFVLARVFSQGAAMRDELEGTV